MSFHVGEILRGTRTFTKFDGTPGDPATVALSIKKPGTATVTYTYALAEITRTGVGAFYKDITLDLAGKWLWKWAATGDPQVVAQGAFIVLDSNT